MTLEHVLKLVELVSILYAVWRVSAQRAKIDAETAEYISVSFESYSAAQELYLTKNSAGNWVFSK